MVVDVQVLQTMNMDKGPCMDRRERYYTQRE